MLRLRLSTNFGNKRNKKKMRLQYACGPVVQTLLFWSYKEEMRPKDDRPTGYRQFSIRCQSFQFGFRLKQPNLTFNFQAQISPYQPVNENFILFFSNQNLII